MILQILLTVAAAQTYEDARRQIWEREAQQKEAEQVARYQAWNQVIYDAAITFAASQNEQIQSGPTCPTIRSTEPVLSYWPNQLFAKKPYEDMSYKRCDFTTTGNRVCQSHLDLIGYGLAARVDCVTNQRDESFLVVNGRVRPYGERTGATPRSKRKIYY